MAEETKGERKKHPGGRPTKMTDIVVGKLETAFAIGANDTQACAFADIGRNAFYEFLKKHPEFQDRKEALKQKPILKALHTIDKNLDDPNTAKWLLEKRCKDFANTLKLDATANITTQQNITIDRIKEIKKQLDNL